MTSTHEVDLRATDAPKAELFHVEAPLLSKGEVTNLIAGCNGLNIHIKVYADGGENYLHAHQNEDHAFLVLEGEATFYDKDDVPSVLGKYDGIMLPRNTLYKIKSSGVGNLVCLRIGMLDQKDINTWPPVILSPDGSEADLADPRLTPVHGVPVEGKFFGRKTESGQ